MGVPVVSDTHKEVYRGACSPYFQKLDVIIGMQDVVVSFAFPPLIIF